MRRLFFILLAAIVLPVLADEIPGSKSIFLVAKKGMPDPFFRDSVVLVSNAAGAPIGVIINKPLDVTLSTAMPEAEKLKSRTDKLYFGGPVNTNDVVFVFRSKYRLATMKRIRTGSFLTVLRLGFGTANPNAFTAYFLPKYVCLSCRL